MHEVIEFVAISGNGDPTLRSNRASEMIRSAIAIRDRTLLTYTDSAQITLCGASTSLRKELTLASSPATAVMANSRLTYKEELLARIARGLPRDRDEMPDDAKIILVAYELLGIAAVEHLEGDFCVVIWDNSAKKLIAARDILGRRRLLYSSAANELVVACSMTSLRSHPGVASTLNQRVIGKHISQMWQHGNETVFSKIFDVPAGHYVAYSPDTPGRVINRRFWNAPEEFDHSTNTDDAAERLRRLLADATREQLADHGVTGITLSGGWDSTAVFATGQNLLRSTGQTSNRIVPVSMSYPVGDSGRENETIQLVCDHWGSEPTWVDIASVRLLVELEERSRQRPEPFSHYFEEWHRALFRKARENGATRILDGYGGDNLFQVSPVYLADILRSFRVVEMIRQWRARGGGSLRNLIKSAVVPNLSPSSRARIGFLRGGNRLRSWWEREPAIFLRKPFLREQDLMEDEVARAVNLPRSATLAEMHSYIFFPFFSRVNHALREIAMSEGLDQGSPLFDSRVVRFAATRPWHERTNMHESKILLRRAMRGLLPGEVLAPRPKRTGTPMTSFRQALLRELPVHVEHVTQHSILEEMGIVAPAAFKWAWNRFTEGHAPEIAAQVLATIQTEYWLRQQLGRG